MGVTGRSKGHLTIQETVYLGVSGRGMVLVCIWEANHALGDLQGKLGGAPRSRVDLSYRGTERASVRQLHIPPFQTFTGAHTHISGLTGQPLKWATVSARAHLRQQLAP